MSEKTKTNIIGIIGVAGLVISIFMSLVLFGPYFGFRLLTVDENLAIITLSIGIAMAVVGISTLVKIATKGNKERIADFANPILKSRGKVSLREIADNLKMDIKIIKQEKYLEKMIEEGYFEDARLEGGWLMKDVIPCKYCGEPIRLTEKKCPNCGAAIKK